MKAHLTRPGGRHCLRVRADAGEAEPEPVAVAGPILADAPARVPLETIARWAKPCKVEMMRFLRGEESL